MEIREEKARVEEEERVKLQRIEEEEKEKKRQLEEEKQKTIREEAEREAERVQAIVDSSIAELEVDCFFNSCKNGILMLRHMTFTKRHVFG